MLLLLFYGLVDEACYFQLATIQSLSTHFRACRLLSSKNFCNVVVRPDVGREGTVRERFFSRGSAPDEEDEDEEGVEKKGEVISFVCRRVWGFCGEVCSSSSLSSSSRLRFSAVFRVLACWGRGAALTLLSRNCRASACVEKPLYFAPENPSTCALHSSLQHVKPKLERMKR